jgi:hypothetical protein
LNDHTYCCQLSPGICGATGEPTLANADKCLNFHRKKLGTRAVDAKRLGVPLYNSEFGACMDSVECVQEINQVADVNEEVGSSGWAYWEFKTYKDLTTSAGSRSEGFYNFDGSLQSKKVKALARTYVQYAQGTVQHSKFATNDQDKLMAGQFVADIEIDTSISAPTEIFALKNAEDAWYPNGWEVVALNADGSTAPATITSDETNNKISIEVKKNSMDSNIMRVCVTPKNVSINCSGYTATKSEISQ